MKTKIFFLIICLIFSTEIFSQTNKIGFRIEPFLFLSKTEGTGPLAYKHKDEGGIYLTSFYLSYRYLISEIISIGTEAGYLWTNEDRYNGFEISELSEININNNASIITGINVHFNKEDFVREFNIKSIVVPSIVLGTEIKISENFKLEFHYLYPLYKDYRTSNSNVPVSYKLAGLLKLSIGYEWEL